MEGSRRTGRRVDTLVLFSVPRDVSRTFPILDPYGGGTFFLFLNQQRFSCEDCGIAPLRAQPRPDGTQDLLIFAAWVSFPADFLVLLTRRG